eukprot:gnl/TRDRNA2_/TRDRNA2_183390_c0_seq1.p1 gnl/TRDRNA2_/TRDRNA2_183390_c0~~gnl/TRDRNA2_/TRDRNA2_183390_c0_seq1.p1  ORF type:complete len:262 (-),score=46.69 gnl/TRDRNA2_/TRDRNA2_183390_c0_seq1:116-901(-)
MASKDQTSELNMDTMCLCVPLRTGVCFTALVTFFFSILCLADRPLMEERSRHWAGGYGLTSSVVVGFVEVTGIVAGAMGMLGCWYSKRSYVKGYNVWQLCRLAAWVWMYIVDIPLLNSCELWVNNINKAIEDHGWNPTMYKIAMDGDCGAEKRTFFICTIICLVVFLYLIWAVFRYQDQMDRTPRHLLRLPKDLTSGAYYSHSLGERSFLNGAWNQEEHNVQFTPAAHMQGPPPMGPQMGQYPGNYGTTNVGPPVMAPYGY